MAIPAWLAEILEKAGEFRPLALYSINPGEMMLLTKDCSFVERPINNVFSVLLHEGQTVGCIVRVKMNSLSSVSAIIGQLKSDYGEIIFGGHENAVIKMIETHNLGHLIPEASGNR